MILSADSECPDQTAHSRSLIWAFAVRICPMTRFRMAESTTLKFQLFGSMLAHIVGLENIIIQQTYPEPEYLCPLCITPLQTIDFSPKAIDTFSTHLCLASHKGTLTNSVDPAQTPQKAAPDPGLHCLH